MKRWPAFAILIMTAASVHAARKTTDDDMAHYTVRPGDTVAGLARTGMVGRGTVPMVLRLNRISAPRRLKVGKILRIPRRLLRDEGTSAVVETYSGPVSLLVGGQPLPPRRGVVIGEGTRIRTGRNGFVTLRLRDGTAVSLPSQTDVGITRLRRVILTGAVEREFTLGDGRFHAIVTPMTLPESNFRVVNPITVSAVRGTDFRVEYAAIAGTAVTEVDEGRVSVDVRQGPGSIIQAKPAMVVAGRGLAASARGAGEPTALLPPPVLDDPGRVQTGERLAFRLVPAAGAVAYRAQVSRDAGALDVIAETQTAGTDLDFDPIPAGTWFLRLATVDAQGIEGTATSYAFDRYRNEVDGRMEPARQGRHRLYLFKWGGTADGTVRYRFRLWAAGRKQTPTVDDVGLRSQTLTVSDLKPGEYYWQVSAIMLVGGRVIESASPERTFQITVPR